MPSRGTREKGNVAAAPSHLLQQRLLGHPLRTDPCFRGCHPSPRLPELALSKPNRSWIYTFGPTSLLEMKVILGQLRDKLPIPVRHVIFSAHL